MAISNDGLTEGAKIGGKLKKLYPTLWLSAFMLSGSQVVAQEQGDRTSSASPVSHSLPDSPTPPCIFTRTDDCVVNLEPFRPQPDAQGGRQEAAHPPADASGWGRNGSRFTTQSSVLVNMHGGVGESGKECETGLAPEVRSPCSCATSCEPDSMNADNQRVGYNFFNFPPILAPSVRPSFEIAMPPLRCIGCRKLRQLWVKSPWSFVKRALTFLDTAPDMKRIRMKCSARNEVNWMGGRWTRIL